MALEPGGYADKLGNRYEGRWVVAQMLRVLNETLITVTLEAVGDSELGSDVIVELPNQIRREQQCKIRNLSSDKWTIADLARRGVLAAMQRFMDHSDTNEFAFVTTIPSTLLHDLSISARASSNNAEEFYQNQIHRVSAERRRGFEEFCERLNLNHGIISDRAKAFSYLKRLFIELWPDNTTTLDNLLHDAVMVVNGDPTTVIAILADFAHDNLRKNLNAASIWTHLEARGFHPRKLDNDVRLIPAVHDLQDRFIESIGIDLIAGEVIPREETEQLLSAVKTHAFVVLHGGPGQGKSGVLFELVQKLKGENTSFLPVRLDRNEPQNTTREFGKILGLPESPALCLRALSVENYGVLILDQLDAIRWTSKHSLNAFEVCKSLVREVKGLRELGHAISVVVACRTYDLQNDPQIKNWIQTEKLKESGSIEIPVSGLKAETVKAIANRFAENSLSLSERQIQILQVPQHLAMWTKIVQSKGAIEFQNRVHLMREFWTAQLEELNRRNVDLSQALDSISVLVDYTERVGSVSAPASVIFNSSVLHALCACGILRREDNKITFGHQSYLDFQIASRVVRELYSANSSITDWLGARDKQSLFRREQLRQALCLLQEESPSLLLQNIERVLTDDTVRFHLKHLCLEVLGQIDNPSAELLAFLIARVHQEYWKDHIIGTVYLRHPPYVKDLIARGTISEWLASDAWQNSALWVLRSVAELIPDEVVYTLRPYLNRDSSWNELILSVLPWDATSDSEEMFRLRSELARSGVYRDHVDWTKLDSSRSLELLDAVASTWKTSDFTDRNLGAGQRASRFECWSEAESARLLATVQAEPLKAWHLLMTHVCRLAPISDKPYGALQLWIEGESISYRYGMEAVPHALIQLVLAAGQILATNSPSEFWRLTSDLRNHASPVVQYVLIETYSFLSAECADAAIYWLLEDLNRLTIGTGSNEPEWMPASRLIERLSQKCSGGIFNELEKSLVHFHSPNELRSAKNWLPSWKEGYFGDYWGRAQHFLLPALDSERRSVETIGLIGVLSRKFENYPAERFLGRSRGRGGFVGSTLGKSVDRISDSSWLKIVLNKRISVDGYPSKHWYDDHITESSIKMFSRDLAHMSKRFPERFGKLALQFPSYVASEYRAAVLEGLSNTNSKDIPEAERQSWEPASASLIEQVLESFPSDTSRTFSIYLCWLIYHRAEETWSRNTISRIVACACNHSDPQVGSIDTLADQDESTTTDVSIANLENKTLNCVRGVAGMAIGELIRNNIDLLADLRPVLIHLCDDKHPAVAIAGIEACLSVLEIDKDFAIDCFTNSIKQDIRVSASRWGVYYFNVGMERHFDLLAPIICEMLDASDDEVVAEGASEITARWLFHGYFANELRHCLEGTIPQRKGVARTASSFVHKPQYFSKCVNILQHLSNDPDKDVRAALREAVNSTEVLSLPGGIQFVLEYIGSKAFLDNPGVVIYTLHEYAGPLMPFSDLLFAVCDQYVGPFRNDTQDPSLGRMHELSEVLSMLMRVYEEADAIRDKAMINRCLDAFDRMFEERVGVVSELAKTIG